MVSLSRNVAGMTANAVIVRKAALAAVNVVSVRPLATVLTVARARRSATPAVVDHLA